MGLLFVGSIFVSIGILSSLLSKNQATAFMLAFLLCFVQFFLWKGIGDLMYDSESYNFFNQIGIYEHYISFQQGLISVKDVVYFIVLKLYFTLPEQTGFIENKKPRGWKKVLNIFKNIILPLTSIFAAQWINIQIDVTQNQRYSLNSETKKALELLDKPLKVDIFLSGKLPTDYLRLKRRFKHL